MENSRENETDQYIFLTYLSNDRDYKGALMLNHMLKKYNSKYALGCIVLENVSEKIRQILENNDIILHEFNLNNILEEFHFSGEYKNYLLEKHYYGKYIIFALTKYKKIIYLDTDLLLKSSIDDLFSFNCENGEIYMTCDTLLTPTNKIKFYMNLVNSGVIVFSPNMEIYNYCYNKLKNYEEVSKRLNELTSDQTIFNNALKFGELNIKYLPYEYNCVWLLTEELLKNNIIDDVKIVHFILHPKPWDYIDCAVSNYLYSNSNNYILEWMILYNEMVAEKFAKCFSKNVYKTHDGYLIETKEHVEMNALENIGILKGHF